MSPMEQILTDRLIQIMEATGQKFKQLDGHIDTLTIWCAVNSILILALFLNRAKKSKCQQPPKYPKPPAYKPPSTPGF